MITFSKTLTAAATAAGLLSGCTAANLAVPGSGAALEFAAERIGERIDDAVALSERFNDRAADDYDTFQAVLGAGYGRMERGRCRWPHTALTRWCERSPENQARCVAACGYFVQPGTSMKVRPTPPAEAGDES